MASGKYAWFICDVCNFRYKYSDRKKTSYGTTVCRDCFDGNYDIQNHPQNFPPKNTRDDENLADASPETHVFTSIES